MATPLNERPNYEEPPKPGTSAIVQNGRYMPPPEDKDGKLWVRTSALVQRRPEDLYALWHEIESAPEWQEEIRQVTRTGPTTSHWVMQSGDKTIEWDSEILNDEPARRIAWSSTGGELETAGEVTFEEAPGGRGTVITVLQEFRMGKLASTWGTLAARNPKQAVIENLRHFKALAEAREIPRTQGQPHGPRGISGKMKASMYAEYVPTPSGERKAS